MAYNLILYIAEIILLFTVNGFCTSEGNIFSYPIPKEEKHLEHNKITEEEKSLFPEFFEGRIAKTPGRFLKIRNYILDCWYVYFYTFYSIIIMLLYMLCII